MTTSFDEAYARYLSALEKLDQTEDIVEKNLLFRQLTRQLNDLETRLNSSYRGRMPRGADEPLLQWDPPVHQSPPTKIPLQEG